MDKRIYLCLAHMSGKEQAFIKEAFDTNWVVPLGPNVNAFEDELKHFVGQDKEVVALSAGTAAIHLGLIQLGVGAGDEVICQSFTFCASANPVAYQGATPVFVDSEEDTWNMDPVLLEEAIKDRIAKTGKKLGFIAQEMGREINTLGSKSNHAEMQKIVVQMKDELEQIKEQVLNVM